MPDTTRTTRDGRAFLILCSHIPGILGTQARGNANFVQELGNVKHKKIGMLILRSYKEIFSVYNSFCFPCAGGWGGGRNDGTQYPRCVRGKGSG